MPTDPDRSDDVISFLRRHDYRLVRDLGRGACGRTVLLYDDQINEYYVCKKYAPEAESQREALYVHFVREIKLLHKLNHNNVVRFFTHYLYPDKYLGYIIMEHVEGSPLDTYLKESPQQINTIFEQAIAGFSYLEQVGILHRDIRPKNIIIRTDNALKIIDLGFGKQTDHPVDYDKSITLNWPYERPLEMQDGRYDFATEVYFVGQMFRQIISENKLSLFKYPPLLESMCAANPANRVRRFSEAEVMMRGGQLDVVQFNRAEISTYRSFSRALTNHIGGIREGSRYVEDIDRIINQLEKIYRNNMLEEQIADVMLIIQSFIEGLFKFRVRPGIDVDQVKDFIRLLRSSTAQQRQAIMANLHTQLDQIERYTPSLDEIPF